MEIDAHIHKLTQESGLALVGFTPYFSSSLRALPLAMVTHSAPQRRCVFGDPTAVRKIWGASLPNSRFLNQLVYTLKNECFFLLSIFFLLAPIFGWGEEKPYIIGSILGGLGNQMFEVATTCALAWDHGAEAYFPDYIPLIPHSQSLHHVLFRCQIFPPKNEISHEWVTPVYGYKSIPFVSGMRLSGYSQSEKYFAHYRDRLIQFFSPKEEDLEYIHRKYSWILEHPESVAIHVRYYFAEKPDEPSFRQYDEEYYGAAMDLFSPNSLFVVFSDNMNFAKKNIPSEGRRVIYVENEPHYIDFYLQTLCKHNLIANSTFSWWAAWLNENPGKKVVRPKLWIGDQDIEGPNSWIQIDAKSTQEKG